MFILSYTSVTLSQDLEDEHPQFVQLDPTDKPLPHKPGKAKVIP